MCVDSIFFANIFLAVSISLFAFLYVDYRYFLSPLNLCLFLFIGNCVIGYILLPFSLMGVIINNADIDEVISSMNKSLYINLVGFFSFLIGTFWFQRKRRNMSFLLEGIKAEKFTSNKLVQIIFFIYIAISSAILVFVFSHTNMIPFFSKEPLQAKYFSTVTSIYVKYRPFYTLGLNMLGLSGIVSLLGLINAIKWKRWMHLWVYFIFSLIIIGMLLLTMKRGYLLLPFALIAGAKLVKHAEWGKKITIFLFGMLILTIIFLAIWLWQFSLHPRYKYENEIEKLEQELPLFLGKHNTAVLRFTADLSNNFFVPVRELGRFIIGYQNSTEYKGFLLGKTYIASLISFIPTEINPYKDKYQIGRITLRVLGDNPDISGAPRIGFAGEAFYNFHLPGVGIIGFLLGFSLMWLNQWYLSLRKANIKDDLPYVILLFLLYHFYGFLESGSATLLFFILNLFLSVPLIWIFIKERSF